MTTAVTTYVAFTIAAVEVPASSDGKHPAGRHLIGAGLFIAQCSGDSEKGWRFARRAQAFAAGDPEACLLEWLADRLPASATLIGWDVDHRLAPLLLDASADAEPELACRFLTRLAEVLHGGVVDLTVGRGGATAPPLAEIAADIAIRSPSWDADATFSAWATGMLETLRQDLADEALALWRLFVRTAGTAGIDAEEATDAWISDRSRIRLVNAAGQSA